MNASVVRSIVVSVDVGATARASAAETERVRRIPFDSIHHGVALGRERVGGGCARVGEANETHDAGGAVFGVGAIGGGEKSAGDQGV